MEEGVKSGQRNNLEEDLGNLVEIYKGNFGGLFSPIERIPVPPDSNALVSLSRSLLRLETSLHGKPPMTQFVGGLGIVFGVSNWMSCTL